MMNFVLKVRNCVSQTRNSEFKMLNLAGGGCAIGSIGLRVDNHMDGETNVSRKS